jgi:hypothetical protein
MLFGAFLFALWRISFPEILATVHTNIDIMLLAGDSLSMTKIVILAKET